MLFADRIALQISTDHPVDGYHPRVSFAGTEFQGLRIGGVSLTPALNLKLCNDGDSENYPVRSCLYNDEFLEFAQRQTTGFANFWSKQPEQPQRSLGASSRYSKDGSDFRQQILKRGNVLWSIVETVEGRCPGKVFGHAIDIPEFGKVFLGELRVDQVSFNLNMLRMELYATAPSSSGGNGTGGSGGKGAGAHGSANGSNSGGG